MLFSFQSMLKIPYYGHQRPSITRFKLRPDPINWKKRGKILLLKEDKSKVEQNAKVSLKDNVLTLEFELNKENRNALIWKVRKEKSSGN